MENLFPLLIFLFIGVNFIVSLIQKAKAQEQRRKRLGEKTQRKPEIPKGTAYERTPQRVDQQRADQQRADQRRVDQRQVDQQRVDQQRVDQGRSRDWERTAWKESRETKPSRQTKAPRGLIREWAKQLEDNLKPLFDIEEEESEKQTEARPRPPKQEIPLEQPIRPKVQPTVMKRKPRSLRPVHRRAQKRSDLAVDYLGRLHPNPLVNGIILSEILAKPIALRDEISDLPN